MTNKLFEKFKQNISTSKTLKKLPSVYFEDWYLVDLIIKNDLDLRETYNDLKIILKKLIRSSKQTRNDSLSSKSIQILIKDDLKDFLADTNQLILFDQNHNCFNLYVKVSDSSSILQKNRFELQIIKNYIFELHNIIMQWNNKLNANSEKKLKINIILDLKNCESDKIIQYVYLIRCIII